MATYMGIALGIVDVIDLSTLKFGDRVPVSFPTPPGEDPYVFRVFVNSITLDISYIPIDKMKVAFQMPIARMIYPNYVGEGIKFDIDDIIAQFKQGFQMPVSGEVYPNFVGMSAKQVFRKWSFRY